MIRRRHVTPEDYTALSDRMGHLLVLRMAMGAVVMAWSFARPESLGVPISALAGATAVYMLAAILAEVARRRAGPFSFAVLNALLLADGVYLAYAMYVTGATQSPIRFLIYLHLVAVSLLASYRTGLKIALWHSLLLFVVLYAQAAGLVPPVDVVPGSAVVFDRMPVLNVTSFWLFAIATSIFSAMNERELRQRRADLQALVDVGARLDDVADPVLQARVVLDGLAARFGFRRGVVLGAAADQLIVLASRGTTEWTDPAPVDAIVRRAWQRRELLPVKRVEADANPLLAAVMPDARNLLVAPLMADGLPVGAIVVEHRVAHRVRRRAPRGIGPRPVRRPWRPSTCATPSCCATSRDLAERDSLTGAANRHMFQADLESTLEANAATGTGSPPSCSSTSTTSRSSTTPSATPPATRC